MASSRPSFRPSSYGPALFHALRGHGIFILAATAAAAGLLLSPGPVQAQGSSSTSPVVGPTANGTAGSGGILSDVQSTAGGTRSRPPGSLPGAATTVNGSAGTGTGTAPPAGTPPAGGTGAASGTGSSSSSGGITGTSGMSTGITGTGGTGGMSGSSSGGIGSGTK